MRILFAILVFLFIALPAISWLFGGEPAFLQNPFEKLHAPTFKEYMANSIAENGDTVLVKTLTLIAYPGARLGIALHNLTLIKKK